MTYGNNNRSSMIRLPQNRFCIEDRASDLTQNPYLTFSLLSAAATKGITKKQVKAEPQKDAPEKKVSDKTKVWLLQFFKPKGIEKPINKGFSEP